MLGWKFKKSYKFGAQIVGLHAGGQCCYEGPDNGPLVVGTDREMGFT